MGEEEREREAVISAARTAVAMSRAAAKGDPIAVGTLWNSAESKDIVVWFLSLHPSVFARQALKAAGQELDIDALFEGMAARLASWP